MNIVDLMALLPREDTRTDSPMTGSRSCSPMTPMSCSHSTGTPARFTNSCMAARIQTRFHVRGFSEQGTTTTPFDMVVLNKMSRYHLVLEALRRSRRAAETGPELARLCQRMLERHYTYVREHLEDMPEVRNWTWSGE